MVEVYTNYWENRRDGVRKEHGSYASEEAAFEGIRSWWTLHQEKYTDVDKRRTNSGALEITYGDDNYYYRIEKRHLDKLPSTKCKLRSPGEIDSKRKLEQLDEETFLFEELAEPYRDLLLVAMGNGQRVKDFIYDEKGRPIRELTKV
ncbi:hypothetical protein [Aerococcus sp. L_32]|uniref:hypothetical protein n=1 Tax=Aerococcus sp. L_32 TaxID=3422316 RepID=UPI003D6AF922